MIIFFKIKNIDTYQLLGVIVTFIMIYPTLFFQVQFNGKKKE